MNLRRHATPYLMIESIAAAAICIVVIRACLQAITIDEAETFLVFVARANPSHWEPASNNHVLNSMLMRFTTAVFGVSHMSVRLPAIAGAVIYIASAYVLCRFITERLMVLVPLFTCMVFNPFILDYLVAARGYSLALGFLLAAIAVAAWARLRAPEMLPRACAAASVLSALAFSANFSFAVVCVFTMVAIFAWSVTAPGVSKAWLALATALPGVCCALLVVGPVAFNWRKGQLTYGAKSPKEMFNSIGNACLYQVNEHLANPWVWRVLHYVKAIVFPLLGLTMLLRLAALRRTIPTVAVACFAIVAATLTVHWICHKVFGLLLPLERTMIYIVPLLTLALGALAASAAATRFSALSRDLLTSALCVTAVYFLFCLRIDYFKEWQWGQDVQRAYWAASYYNHRYGIRQIYAGWLYAPALNFYRRMYQDGEIEEFGNMERFQPNRQVYILHSFFDHDTLANENLKVTYHGEHTPIVVAVRAELEKPQH